MTPMIVHYRNFNEQGGIHNMGGITLAIEKKGPNDFTVAYAICSELDNFNKQTGRTKAISRLKSKKAIPLVVAIDADLNTIWGRKNVMNATDEFVKALGFDE